MLATALFVSDDNTARKLIEENPNMKVMIIDKDLNRKMYNSFEELVFP